MNWSLWPHELFSLELNGTRAITQKVMNLLITLFFRDALYIFIINCNLQHRTSQDVVPGLWTLLWSTSTTPLIEQEHRTSRTLTKETLGGRKYFRTKTEAVYYSSSVFINCWTLLETFLYGPSCEVENSWIPLETVPPDGMLGISSHK